jgi:hypothetical protein
MALWFGGAHKRGTIVNTNPDAGENLSGMNLHGSLPTSVQNYMFEPNFRHFDYFMTDTTTPDATLAERLFKRKDTAPIETNMDFGVNIRHTPILISTLFPSMLCTFIHPRLIGKVAGSMRGVFVRYFSLFLVYNNLSQWYGREKQFRKDFQRNQAYAAEEYRYQRDVQRVKEIIYEKQFVKNPVAEYRVKAWQTAERFA